MEGLNCGLWRVGTVVVCMRYVFYGRRNSFRRKQKLDSENYNGGGENDERENGSSGKGAVVFSAGWTKEEKDILESAWRLVDGNLTILARMTDISHKTLTRIYYQYQGPATRTFQKLAINIRKHALTPAAADRIRKELVRVAVAVLHCIGAGAVEVENIQSAD